MPTEPAAGQQVAGGGGSGTVSATPDSVSGQAIARRTRERRALRLGIGVTLTFVIALAGFALSVVMILYGESIIPFSDEGGANFADRLGELGMAAIYAIAGLYVLDAYSPTSVPGSGKRQAR